MLISRNVVKIASRLTLYVADLGYNALHCEKPVSRSGTLLNGWCKFHKSRYNSRHHFIMSCGVFSCQIIFFM